MSRACVEWLTSPNSASLVSSRKAGRTPAFPLASISGSSGGREQHPDARTLGGLGVKLGAATLLLDQPTYGRQAEAEARRAVRREAAHAGLERTVADLGRDAGAVVAHGDESATSLGSRIHLDMRRLTGAGVSERVGDEVHEHTLEGDRVGAYRRQFAPLDDRTGLRDAPGNGLQRAVEHAFQVSRGALVRRGGRGVQVVRKGGRVGVRGRAARRAAAPNGEPARNGEPDKRGKAKPCHG